MNINFRNKKGFTPLMTAAAQCNWEQCQCLLCFKPEFLPKNCPAQFAPWKLATDSGDASLGAYLKAAYGEYRVHCIHILVCMQIVIVYYICMDSIIILWL